MSKPFTYEHLAKIDADNRTAQAKVQNTAEQWAAQGKHGLTPQHTPQQIKQYAAERHAVQNVTDSGLKTVKAMRETQNAPEHVRLAVDHEIQRRGRRKLLKAGAAVVGAGAIGAGLYGAYQLGKAKSNAKKDKAAKIAAETK